jgi:ribosome biogenesis GTPase / thiamine phosphate phosphatase
VGKSTLLNNLSGKNIMKTEAISESTHKGRHITSHRELIVLENGGIIIDNPGMREVGIADASRSVWKLHSAESSIFHRICKFIDCTHTGETGCAVLEALENLRVLDQRVPMRTFMKLEREKTHFETSVAEKRKKEKIFGKIIKDYYKRDIKNRKH